MVKWLKKTPIDMLKWKNSQCLFILLQCAIMYIRTSHSNTKHYEIQFFWPKQFERHCRFTIVNHDLTTQLSIIITGLLTPCSVQDYFKDGGPKLACQSQNALWYSVTFSGCLKLSQSMSAWKSMNVCKSIKCFSINVGNHLRNFIKEFAIMWNKTPVKNDKTGKTPVKMEGGKR